MIFYASNWVDVFVCDVSGSLIIITVSFRLCRCCCSRGAYLEHLHMALNWRILSAKDVRPSLWLSSSVKIHNSKAASVLDNPSPGFPEDRDHDSHTNIFRTTRKRCTNDMEGIDEWSSDVLHVPLSKET